MKGDTPSLAHNHHEYTSANKQTPRKRPVSRTHDDNDWQTETPKRRPTKSGTHSDRKVSSASAAAIETNVNRIIQSVEKEAAAEAKEARDAKPSPKPAEPPSPTKSKNRPITTSIKQDSEKKKEQQQLQVGVNDFFIVISLSNGSLSY